VVSGHSDCLADPSGIQILNWAQTFRLFYRDAAGNDRSLMRDDRYEAAICSSWVWDRLTGLILNRVPWHDEFGEAVEDPRRQSCVVLHVYINLLRLILMMTIWWHGRRQVSRPTEWCCYAHRFFYRLNFLKSIAHQFNLLINIIINAVEWKVANDWYIMSLIIDATDIRRYMSRRVQLRRDVTPP